MSRRKRRGEGPSPSPAAEGSGASEVDPARPPKQFDPKTFAQVDKALGSFAQRRFGKAMPALAAAFFGIASKEERTYPELQAAYALYVCYGWQDEEGRRIVDMFAEHGLKMSPEEQRLIEALRRARMVLFVSHHVEPANKQIVGRCAMRDEAITILDHGAFSAMKPGDGLLTWVFPVGALSRPFGPGTLVPKRAIAAIEQAAVKLADDENVTLADLADKRPSQLFWLVYRAVELAQ